MKLRRATSLLELVLIMSACTVVLTLTGVLLQRAMRLQMHSRSHVNAERTSLRLANQFRRDVHNARDTVEITADDAKTVSLQLKLADGRTATYSRSGGAVLRLENGGGKPDWREEFVFPALHELTIAEQTAPRRLALNLAVKGLDEPSVTGAPPANTLIVPVSIRVEAVVGRDLRFSAARSRREAPE
jgi:hypothetical protein